MGAARRVFLALLPLLVGCVTTAPVGLARTLPKGHGALVVDGGVVLPREVQSERTPIPGAIGVRYGLAENVEAGYRTFGFLWGSMVDAKLRLVVPPDEGTGLALAVDPAVGYWSEGPGTIPTGSALLPVIAGWQLRGGHQVAVDVRAGLDLTADRNLKVTTTTYLGGGVTLGIRMGPVMLMPSATAVRAGRSGTAAWLLRPGLAVSYEAGK